MFQRQGHTSHTSTTIFRARSFFRNNSFCFDCGKRPQEEGAILCNDCHTETRLRNNLAQSARSRGVKKYFIRPYAPLG